MGPETEVPMSSKLLKVSAFVLTLALVASCGGSGKKTVGIAKFVAHPSLDIVEQGVMDAIKEAKPDIVFDQQNSNADMATAAQIAQRFKDQKVAVAVGIATPTAQALANQIKDRPIVYSVVTDPVAAGLVESLDKGGANITGTSDMTPVREQLDMLLAIAPVKRLGHLYASGEANSVAIAAIVKTYCEEKGVEFVEATVTNSSEVKSALLSIADRIDGLYLGNDNTVFSALSAVSEVTLAKKLPLMSADPVSAETIPVLAALGYDYYQMGRETGKIVVRILNGEKTKDIPSYMPTDPASFVLVLNQDVAATLGLTLDQALLDRAKIIVAGGQVTKK